MKICPVCKLESADSYIFCPEDGTALNGEAAPALVRSDAAPRDQSQASADGSAVLLYCPQCAAEYPLTFTECPVHTISLTNRRAKARIPTVIKPAVESVKEAPLTHRQTARLAPATTGILDAATFAQEQTVESQEVAPDTETVAVADEGHVRDEPIPWLASEDGQANSHSFRRAAIAIAAVLVLFGVVGLFSLVKHLTRRPTLSNAPRAAQAQEWSQPVISVPTPPAALEYKGEPQTAPPAKEESQTAPSAPVVKNTETRDEADRSRDLKEARTISPVRTGLERARTDDPRPALAASRPVNVPPVARPDNRAVDLSLPRPSGQIAARLLNVRSNRTAKGYRYDLTFNVQERGGQATQLERPVISTRSASGINHAQAIPFYHRLGATGTLTFTVSVEMPGRAPSDWQGRVLCTSIGSDVEGKVHQASFGATVNPN